MLKRNVGTVDRVLRIIVGAAMLIAFFALPEAGYRWWLLIGVVPLVTGLMSSCLIYTVLGLNTCPMKRS
jgi:hypothetical protein